MSATEIIATFDSTHHALRFEKTLKQNEIALVVMPVPREISASCGLAVKFGEQDLAKAKDLAGSNEILVKKYYEIKINDNKREYLTVE